MLHTLISFFLVIAMNIQAISASTTEWECQDRAIKSTKNIIQSESLYSEEIYDGEMRISSKFERDEDGNAFETHDIGFRVGPSQRFVLKYLVEEGHCTLLDIQVKY